MMENIENELVIDRRSLIKCLRTNTQVARRPKLIDRSKKARDKWGCGHKLKENNKIELFQCASLWEHKIMFDYNLNLYMC